ncbi:MAG: terminase large subunit [Eubacteriales bacterium]|nr:terminase large subunit [Eubacteriales bacterium]
MAEKRIGNQDPTRKVVLDYKKTFGQEAVDLYEQSGRTAQTWQKNIADAILATRDDDLWAHTKFGFSLPRRNGKNEILLIRELWGLLDGEYILHTAHRTTTSKVAWERLCRVLDEAKIEYQSLRAVGRENIRLEETGGHIEFRTRSTTGGLGEGYDLLVLDEAQEYTTDQETALKYTVTSSRNPQTILTGTPPTPLSSGTVFPDYRRNILDGNTKDWGWMEWGVDEESDPDDRDLWYRVNPSLGTVFTERSVADEIGSDKIDFNIQRLGLWIRYNQKSAISERDWDALRISRLPALVGKLFIGIKFGQDGENVALSIAVKTKSGLVFVESIDCQSVRNGLLWIIRFLQHVDVAEVVIDGASGQNLLAETMKEYGLEKPVLPTVNQIIMANSAFEQAIFQQMICHRGQPSLSVVATNCEKRNIGSHGGFGYRSQLDDHDISLLDSVMLAHWACINDKPGKKQTISY